MHGDRLSPHTGRRRDPAQHHPRFVCSYNDAEVFSADLHPAISANPFIAFSTIAT
jgi:sulfur-oxidizing protein SoxZ